MAAAVTTTPASILAAGANAQSVSYARGIVAAIGALSAGIIGITGLTGFVVYVALHLLVTAVLLLRMRCSPSMYLAGEPSPLAFAASGITDNLLLFVFCWTLGYAVVHIY